MARVRERMSEEALERLAEDRAEAKRGPFTSADVEKPDRWGRDADWHYPRGYGGF